MVDAAAILVGAIQEGVNTLNAICCRALWSTLCDFLSDLVDMVRDLYIILEELIKSINHGYYILYEVYVRYGNLLPKDKYFVYGVFNFRS